jgi:hypothetical protein
MREAVARAKIHANPLVPRATAHVGSPPARRLSAGGGS